MPLKQYGVLKGTIIGHLRDADDDHYQVLVQCGKVLHRIAVNVRSSAKNAPSTVLFQATTQLPDDLTNGLEALPPGYKKLPSKPDGLAQDYVRGGVAKLKSMTPVPPDAPGEDNDLKDKLEAAVLLAMKAEGSLVYAFGDKWGPEKGKPDQYFKFEPGNGIHDIHMNQGNEGSYKKDNGVYQDGAVLFSYPDGKWRAYFFAFQSQKVPTDEKGNPTDDATEAVLPKQGTRSSKPARGQKPKAKSRARAGAKTKSRVKPAVRTKVPQKAKAAKRPRAKAPKPRRAR